MTDFKHFKAASQGAEIHKSAAAIKISNGLLN
jgi:hypothetical protein